MELENQEEEMLKTEKSCKAKALVEFVDLTQKNRLEITQTRMHKDKKNEERKEKT